MAQFILKEDLEKYFQKKQSQGVTLATIRKYRTHLQSLLQWLPEDKCVTKERIMQWHDFLEKSGYSQVTIQKYVTDVNTYLREVGQETLCFSKSRFMDLRGMTFGNLTVLEPTEKRWRRDIVWRCRCKCGKEVEVRATSLRSGNTTSCGCLHTKIFQEANQYMEGTSLRQSLENKVYSSRNVSGYVGVSPKREKWQAFITYKGIRYHLGVYANLEEAVRARMRGKERVVEEAKELLQEYKKLHGNQGEVDLKDEKAIKET